MPSLTATLTSDQQQLQDAAIEFARQALGRDMIDRDRAERFSRDDWQRCAEFGVHGMPISPEYGGMGLGILPLIAVMDDAGIASCPVMGWSMGVNTAFELAYLHPHRVSALFAVAGVPGGTFASMLAPLGVPRFVRAAITVNAARAMGALGRPLSLVASRLPSRCWR